ncbi:hypothetical protein Tco_0676395, partial [Tanacetum coccineum]
GKRISLRDWHNVLDIKAM